MVGLQLGCDSTVVNSAALAGISLKIQWLAVHTCIAPPMHLTNNLLQLNSLLNTILASFPWPTVLPKVKKIAPNQHSWPETKLVMGTHIKMKCKSQHTDPYSGGEQYGKKAKADARQPLLKPTARYVTNVMHLTQYWFLIIFSCLWSFTCNIINLYPSATPLAIKTLPHTPFQLLLQPKTPLHPALYSHFSSKHHLPYTRLSTILPPWTFTSFCPRTIISYTRYLHTLPYYCPSYFTPQSYHIILILHAYTFPSWPTSLSAPNHCSISLYTLPHRDHSTIIPSTIYRIIFTCTQFLSTLLVFE